MSEDFLIYLWTCGLIKPNLQTTNGETLNVIYPGQRNHHSGPDFFNSKIRIDGTIWAGNVEIHVMASDWFLHRHQNDEAYENIILHVVYEEDKAIYRKNNEPLPTLELKGNFDEHIYKRYLSFIESNKWIPCEDQISKINHFDLLGWLDNLMAERLAQKAEVIQKELAYTKQDFQEVFYQKIATNFGFKVNAMAFGLLARSLPLKILVKHKNDRQQLEALLFGQAGLLSERFKDPYPQMLLKEYTFLAAKYQLKPIDKKLWKFMRMRPVNFPTIRISQFANMIYKSSALISHFLEAEKLSFISQLLNTETTEYWKDHYQFDRLSQSKTKRLGQSSINLILINTVIPFLFVYGKMKNDESLQEKAINWMEEIKPESNTIIRKFVDLGIQPKNAMQSQALIQLKNIYCDQKRCLECRIGHIILKSQ